MSGKYQHNECPPLQDHYERRGTSIYGEDRGPGTAPFIADCSTVTHAERIVAHLNALVLQRDNARFAAGIVGDLP
jgi:hypothetical protein